MTANYKKYRWNVFFGLLIVSILTIYFNRYRFHEYGKGGVIGALCDFICPPPDLYDVLVDVSVDLSEGVFACEIPVVFKYMGEHVCVFSFVNFEEFRDGAFESGFYDLNVEAAFYRDNILIFEDQAKRGSLIRAGEEKDGMTMIRLKVPEQVPKGIPLIMKVRIKSDNEHFSFENSRFYMTHGYDF